MADQSLTPNRVSEYIKPILLEFRRRVASLPPEPRYPSHIVLAAAKCGIIIKQ
jgi:hypothetical protein